LDFQKRASQGEHSHNHIFYEGHGDIPMTVRAMKAGAIRLSDQTLSRQDMLDAVTTAIARDQKKREDEKVILELRALFEALTPREREMMALVTAGRMNKQIGSRDWPC